MKKDMKQHILYICSIRMVDSHSCSCMVQAEQSCSPLTEWSSMEWLFMGLGSIMEWVMSAEQLCQWDGCQWDQVG